MRTIFLDACRGKQTDRTPVWYMRQAGRCLPQYRKIKEKHSVLDICRSPELATEVALLPVDILGVDAAILFADIMIPLLGVGVDLDIVEHVGPVIHQPIQTMSDITKLRPLEPERDVPYLLTTIALLRKELEHKVPLIGFSAAPFTLASYLIEGKPTRDFIKTKSFMYNNPADWNVLMTTLSDIITVYLRAQVAAGVQALQVFDSWVGCLSDRDYQDFVLPHTMDIFHRLRDVDVPLIHFGTNTAGLLTSFASVDCHVIGVDWRISLSDAWETIHYRKSLQGNLDPALLLGEFALVQRRVDEMFASLPKRQGYIFNLGHGVLPQTPLENLIDLTAYVHEQ
jgi:uroporphyrinogen decarboxylase